MSQNNKRFSREGFEKLYGRQSDEQHYNMNPSNPNPNDVTIDIPLTKVTSSRSTGARKPTDKTVNMSDPTAHPEITNEKHSHFHRGAGRRKKLDQQLKTGKDTQEGSLTFMGKLYNKIYHFSVITRYMLYVAPVALCLAVPIIIGATVAPNARIGGSAAGTTMLWFFVWLEVVWCSLWVSKLFARFLPRVFQFLIGVVSAGTRKYALILAALEFPLSLVGWAVASVATIKPLLTLTPNNSRASGANWINILQKILFACLFSTLVLLVEKVLIQLISISYHRKQFDDKIKASKRNIYLTTRLYDASRTLFPPYCPEFAEEDYTISDVLGLDGLSSRDPKSHKRSGSNTPLRLFQNVQRVGDKVTAAFGNIAQEVTGKQLFDPTASHSIVVRALEKKRSSEALARRLWLSFVLEGKDALYLEDLIDVFGSDRQDEAEEIFAALDLDGNADISLDEMILRVGDFGRERAALANSMRDVDQAITVLDNLLLAVVFLLSIFIFIAWLNQNFTTTLATAGTALLSMSFVFAATAQELLGSCIFLFVKHPYDVGDRVDIGGEPLVVERISLLYSMFRKVNDHKRTQVPHIVLNSLWIDNVSRSKAMRERLDMYVSFDTTFADIEFLRKEMQNFVLAKENARDFLPDVDIELTGIAEMNKMELRIEIRHKSNWANETVRAARRSKFMCALVMALRKIPIYAPGGGGAAAGDKANPTYSVAISDTEAEANKAQFAKDKEAARMIPSNSQDENTGTSSSNDFMDAEERERANMQQMNQRNVIADPARDNLGQDDVALDRKRTNDIEEVKTILRKESTRGRRKASQHSPELDRTSQEAWSPVMGSGSLAPQQFPPRVSYYEDNSMQQAVSNTSAPSIQVSSPGAVPYPPEYPGRLQTRLPPAAAQGMVSSPTSYTQDPPPRAYGHSARQPQPASDAPSRRPVPEAYQPNQSGGYQR